jgi:hypothetical protein
MLAGPEVCKCGWRAADRFAASIRDDRDGVPKQGS